MKSRQESVHEVARLLKRGGLGNLIAALLEAGGPLRIIGAQAAFIFDPLVGGDGGTLTKFGEILEDPEAYDDLIEVLRDRAI